jgi:putative phosphoribosyl transferase
MKGRVMLHLFSDREDAAHQLAQALADRGWDHDPLRPDLILGLARGGVVLARILAETLKTPWDVLVVRKIGAPDDPELGIGALCEDGSPLFSKLWMKQLGLRAEDLTEVVYKKQNEMRDKVNKYRGFPLPLLPVPQRVCVVDDGLATGVSAEAAATYLRRHSVPWIALVVPIGAPDTIQKLTSPGKLFDQVIALQSPSSLGSVGSWYENFQPVEDPQVLELLGRREKAIA